MKDADPDHGLSHGAEPRVYRVPLVDAEVHDSVVFAGLTCRTGSLSCDTAIWWTILQQQHRNKAFSSIMTTNTVDLRKRTLLIPFYH